MVVGWYHSHPGFGCWLSGVDIGTQQSFEALNARAVSVVIDPIQSVRGKVVIDAFRLINPQTMMLGQEPRQATSNLGHLHKPAIQALIHGLNRHYYSIAINHRKNALEEGMLASLRRRGWAAGLDLRCGGGGRGGGGGAAAPPPPPPPPPPPHPPQKKKSTPPPPPRRGAARARHRARPPHTPHPPQQL
jgi:hypothetical protein